jgi:hypothetical protein
LVGKASPTSCSEEISPFVPVWTLNVLLPRVSAEAVDGRAEHNAVTPTTEAANAARTFRRVVEGRRVAVVFIEGKHPSAPCS